MVQDFTQQLCGTCECVSGRQLSDSPPQQWKRAVDWVGGSWTTRPATPECWNPAAAVRW